VTSCTSLSLAQALDYAIAHDRAQIINLSLSGPRDPLLARLVDLALARGIAVVAAADQALRGGGFPASHPGVLAVADQESGAAEPGMLLAPGRDVPATGPPGRWVLVTGSSFAAAHVSGLLGLLREAGASRTMPVADASSGDVLVRLPSGAIDACASLMRRRGTCACGCATAGTAAPDKPP
jgi:subtilisin family serine protease